MIQLFYSCMTCACIKKKKEKSRHLDISSCRPRGYTSPEASRAERWLWKAGFPRSGTLLLPTLRLSCLACWLLSCPWGLLSSWDSARRRSAAPGSRKLRVLQDVAGVGIMVVLCGLHCAHTSSVYFLHNLDYCYWFMTAGHVLRCVGRAPELKNKTKEKAISLSLLWQWMRVAPEKLATLSSAFTFNWDITHWLNIKPFQWRLWVWPFHCAADPNRKAFWVHT